MREVVAPEQEIGRQLERLGITPSDIRWVVMTHLTPTTPVGCITSLNNEILVSRTELEYAAGLRGRLRGTSTSPGRSGSSRPWWISRRWSSSRFPRACGSPKPGTSRSADPGHSPGQLAVLIDDGDHTVLLAGDSSYTENAMLRGAVDGVGPDEDAERLTHERIRAYAAATPTVPCLPSHDPETAIRLAERRPVGAVREGAAA